MPTQTLKQPLSGTPKKKKKAAKKVPRHYRPENMELKDWQTALRKQYAVEQKYRVKNLGDDPVFSEFSVTNPKTRRTYRVVVRGMGPGINYCSCPDYSINTLGTCKHIEGVLHRIRKGNAKRLAEGFKPNYPEVYVRYGDRRAIVFAPGNRPNDELQQVVEKFFSADGVIKPTSYARFDDFLEQARAASRSLRVYDDVLAYVAQVRDDEARVRKLQSWDAKNAGAAYWKKLLKVDLLPYQREGALFAARAGRAIIADEMGLGKTIQGIAAAEILAQTCGLERVLVVCPSSLKYQWLSEIGKFSDRAARVIEGGLYDRRGLYRNDPAFFKIANYDVIHHDLEAIAAWQPDLVILDEAQRIKNWATRTAQTIKRLESRYAIVLTGTPLENRLEELHSIVEFVDRHRLGPLFAFKARHEETEGDTNRVVGYRELNKVSETLAPILIRRRKSEVLTQLPPRSDKNFFVPMTGPQWEPYRENQDTVARLVHKWQKYKFLNESDQLRLRISLQNMRMACDSTYLLDKETKHGTKVNELSNVLGEMFERPESKAVIFSQWVRMNELVEEMLRDRGWRFVHLHGGLDTSKRKDVVNAFREEADCRVFLSTDAGGVGLNLQHAANVVNMDLPWNPAVLEQRIGRVHRMGQKEPVQVVNFVSEGTIEHGMLSVHSFKKSVFAGVLDGATDRVFMGEGAMKRFMKTVESAMDSTPSVQATPVDAPGDDSSVNGNGKHVALDEDGELEHAAASGMRAGGTARRAQSAADGRSVESGPDVARSIAGAAGGLETRSLGEWLSQGAYLLGTIARELSAEQPASRGSRGSTRSDSRCGAASDLVSQIVRVHKDQSSGKSELRIAVPDEQVVRKWVDGLVNLFGAMTSD
jgi:superfamily II DNA or RNA helicase